MKAHFFLVYSILCHSKIPFSMHCVSECNVLVLSTVSQPNEARFIFGISIRNSSKEMKNFFSKIFSLGVV